jgi:ferritin
MLQWFIEEQVEEEANATAILGKPENGRRQGVPLMHIDKMLGQRKED